MYSHFMAKRGSDEWRQNISNSLKGRTDIWNTGTKGIVRPNKGSFKKGMVPWNKGKKGVMPVPWNLGIPRTEEVKQKIRETKKIKGDIYNIPKGELHWNWSGDNVSYSAVHRWILKYYGKPNKCEKCGIENLIAKNGQNKIHWSNISGEYKRNRNDWEKLCISCHFKKDGLVKNFHKE